MVNKIIFKENDSLLGKEWELNLKDGTNIIVGPKGGGSPRYLI